MTIRAANLILFCLLLAGYAHAHDSSVACGWQLAPDDKPTQAKSVQNQRIVVIGGGRSGAISSALIKGIQRFQKRFLATTFLTASRTQQESWPGSLGHHPGIDRNDEQALTQLIEKSQPTVLIDAAGAHMAEVLNLQSVEAAREAGRAQARMLIRHLRGQPERTLIFISSQYASPDLKDKTPVDKRFEVVGISEPVPVRLYAEMKEGYEAELLDQYKADQFSSFVILRLGTLLSPNYRAKSVETLIAAGGNIQGKHFTPEIVLTESVLAILDRLKKQTPMNRILEISSKNEFSDVKDLGVQVAPLNFYVKELDKSWKP